jgi:hypothetical protein
MSDTREFATIQRGGAWALIGALVAAFALTNVADAAFAQERAPKPGDTLPSTALP